MMQLQASGVANGTGSVISLAQYDFTLGEQSNAVWRMCAPRYMFPTTTIDGLHHPASANIWAGEYVGHCRRWEEVNAAPWTPTYPLTLALDATDKALIHTTWRAPVSPLAFDTSAPIQGAAYQHGLEFIDDCVAVSLDSFQQPYAYVTGATLTGAATMDVTLSAPRNPACGTPRLRNAYNGPAVVNQTNLPIVASGGSGGTDGACVIATSFDPSGPGVAQATYNATITGGALVSINSLVYAGLWPIWDQGTKNGVSVSGCGLTGATIDDLRLRRGFSSLAMSAAWSDIRDSDTTVSRSGNALRNWAVVFDRAITP